MDSETPTPQDPSRFSKATSEPVILDLEATEQKPQSAKAEDAPRTEPKAAPSQAKPKAPLRLPVAEFLGGIIGGGIIALGVLGYSQLTNDLSSKVASLEQALVTKAEQSDTQKFNTRLSTLESALTEAKTALVASAKKSATLDPSMIKRLDDLETAFKSLSGRDPIVAVTEDRRPLRLALILLLRDDVKTDQPTTGALTALEALGEAHPAFTQLKDNLALPLPSYAALVDEAMRQMKSSHEKTEVKLDDTATPSRFPSFLSQLITVRSVKTTEPVPVDAGDIIEPIVSALEDQHAGEALKLIATLPNDSRTKFKSLESDIARRAKAEAAIVALLDDALGAITKGDNP